MLAGSEAGKHGVCHGQGGLSCPGSSGNIIIL